MYSIELIDIKTAIPKISNQNFAKIDDLLGSVGSGGIFRKTELLRILSQKGLINEVEKFLIEKKIVEPFRIACSNCGKEFPLHVKTCEYCNTDIYKNSSITYYKIISDINLSDSEKERQAKRNKELDITAFKLLLKKIDRLKRKNEYGYLVFFDLANSTKLSQTDKYTHGFICKNIISFIKEITKPFFLRSNAIVVKSEGDASYIFFTNLEDMKEFIKDFILNIRYQEFYTKIIEYNNEYDANIYIKGYCAGSEVNEYHRTDLLSLDFESMEAFTFINRIEKESKTQLLNDYKYTEKELFPLFLISRQEYFKSKKIELNNINNYKNVEVYLSFINDIEVDNQE